MSEPITIKLRGVVIRIYEWRGMWRFAWTDRSSGKRKYTTRKTIEDARTAARERAAAIGRGSPNIEALSPAARERLARLLDADPQLTQVDKFFSWHRSRRSVTVKKAIEEFLDAKRRTAGLSAQNVVTLETALKNLSHLNDSTLASVTHDQLEEVIHGNGLSSRSQSNRRNAIVTFFRWCRMRELLPDERTSAERTGKIKNLRKVPCTYTPDQIQILLANVRPKYLPWLAISAFAGVRADELMPMRNSRTKKSPLDWQDMVFERGIIIVRPETAKNGQRRIIPICDALRAWLEPVAAKSGPVVDMAKKDRETLRLGALIGGWKPNALRHSFISYRAAIVGIARAAMEAGNSENETRRSYNDAKSQEEADRWFSIMPPSSAKVPQKS